MGGVDQAPVGVHGDMVQQPGHRPPPAPAHAVLDFAQLLGDMDVNGRRLGRGLRRGGQLREQGRAHRAQRMRGHADAHQGVGAVLRAEVLDDVPHECRVAAEAGLRRAQRFFPEAGMGVEDGQMGDRDARGERRRHHRARELGRFRVGRPVGLAVQIVELADRGIALLEQLDIELGGDGADAVGIEPRL